jgi:hypothetical protein
VRYSESLDDDINLFKLTFFFKHMTKSVGTKTECTPRANFLIGQYLTVLHRIRIRIFFIAK